MVPPLVAYLRFAPHSGSRSLRSSRSPTALMWPASFSSAHVVMPQASRSQTSGSSSMTSGRGQVMRVRFRAVQDFDRPPRRDTHLHARAGCAPLQQKQRVAHGHRPHRAWQDRGDGQTMWCVVRQLPGRGTPLHQRVMPAFQVFFKNYCHVSHHGTGAGRSSIMQTMAYGVMRNIGACATL